ncbi:MAG: sigma-70 family RNA polymerase sigma factor [Nannocystaceae bacterium]|nr:sigma-70 family RNA polymerase sigma factor [Nannocystaceae bacterium]
MRLDDSELARRIGLALERGPDPAVSVEDVLRFIEQSPLTPERLKSERLDDIVLALSCARGSETAADRFVADFGQMIRAVANRSLEATERDEYHQSVLMHLLVDRADKPAGVALYRGRGSLRAFVRVTASRLAIDLRRARGVEPKVLELRAEMAQQLDPETVVESAELKELVVAALGHALRNLKPGERRALRMRYVLGLSVARTAEALGIHEISVSRLVSRVRAQVLEQVQTELARGTNRLDQGVLAALAESLDFSVARWLQTNLD